MGTHFKYDVFLSHSTQDKDVVREIAGRLKADGVRVWFDEWEIQPGDSIPAKIEEGLEDSRVLVLCMSSHAFSSEWAQLESHTYRYRDPLNKDRRFIPLRLDDADVKGSLAQFRYIDWRNDCRQREYENLIVACKDPSTWVNIGDQLTKDSCDRSPQSASGNPLDEPPEISWRRVRAFHPRTPRTDSSWRRHLEELKELFQAADHRDDETVGCIAIESIDSSRKTQEAESDVTRALPSSVERLLGRDRENSDSRCGLHRSQQVRVGIDRHSGVVVSEELLREATSRWLYVYGQYSKKRSFDHLSRAASRCIVRLPAEISTVLWQDWLELDHWHEEDDLWVDAVFELAWQEHSPLLHADRYYWSGNNTCRVSDASAHASMFGGTADGIPETAWFSKLDDLIRSSIHAIDVLLALNV